jgi:hypothetical protein
MTRASIIVGVASGAPEVLQRHLRALAAQTARPFEVIVPHDPSRHDVAGIAAANPDVRVLPVAVTASDVAAGRSHDVLRTAGLREATGDVVLLIEDQAVAAPGWLAAMLEALARRPDAAGVAGAIDCAPESALAWSQWCCDFARYQPPLLEGGTDAASDTNVAYRRSALDAVADAWSDVYHEPAVHAALARAGLPLYAAPAAVVTQMRPAMTFAGAWRERVSWGRAYGAAREGLTPASRALRVLASPLLPLVRTARSTAVTLARGRQAGRLWRCLPLVFVLDVAWTAGEVAGYLGGSPAVRRPPSA